MRICLNRIHVFIKKETRLSSVSASLRNERQGKRVFTGWRSTGFNSWSKALVFTGASSRKDSDLKVSKSNEQSNTVPTVDGTEVHVDEKNGMT